MKARVLAAVLVTSGCATTSPTSDLDGRLASWVGASVHTLAAALGAPTSAARNSWEWRFTQAELRRDASSAALFGSPVAQRPRSASGSMTSPGIQAKAGAHDETPTAPASECAYRALTDGDTIVRLEAVTLSGRCRFGELPPVPQGSPTD